MKKKYQSIRLFKSPFLERFSHVHPIEPLLVWGPVSLFLMIHSLAIHHVPLIKFFILGICGFLSWPILEYTIHRFIFHFPTQRVFIRKLQFIIHGIHHADPKDPTRLLMPPAGALILAVPLFLLFRGLLGAEAMEPYFGFLAIGYLCYDYLHYYFHFSVPKNRTLRKLRSHHLRHHYATPYARFGVTSPLFDILCQTTGPKNFKSATEHKP